jgi:hypothetical protein
MVAALLLLLVASAPPTGFAAANTPEGTSDSANRIATIEKRMASRMGVAALDSGSGKRLDTARRLQNSLLEFRRCINVCEHLAFVHEDARTPSAA